MEWLKKNIKGIIFNIAETIVIFLVGLALELDIKFIIMLMLTFIISRGLFGKALHFKTWYRCLIWSTLIMLSIFVILKVDLVISILFAIFSALIMTGKSDIACIYLWKNHGEPSKYQDIIDYIKYNEYEDKLVEFEKKLKENNTLEYLIYKYRFKDNRTFGEISDLLDIEGPRIAEKLDKVAFAIRIYCKF